MFVAAEFVATANGLDLFYGRNQLSIFTAYVDFYITQIDACHLFVKKKECRQAARRKTCQVQIHINSFIFYIGFIIKFVRSMRALLQPDKLFSNKFRAGECVCGILGCCIMKQMPRNLTTSFFFCSYNQHRTACAKERLYRENQFSNFRRWNKFNKQSRVMITIMIMCFGMIKNTEARACTQNVL